MEGFHSICHLKAALVLYVHFRVPWVLRAASGPGDFLPESKGEFLRLQPGGRALSKAFTSERGARRDGPCRSERVLRPQMGQINLHALNGLGCTVGPRDSWWGLRDNQGLLGRVHPEGSLVPSSELYG